MADTDPTETSQEQPDPPDAPVPEAAEEVKPDINERIEGISKALQKNTMILSHLQKKIDGGGDLNAVERAKLEMAAADAAKLRKEIEEYAESPEGDPDGIDKKATRAISALMKRQDALEAENKSLREQRSDPDQKWSDEKETYGVPIPTLKSIWKESIDTAKKTAAVRNAKTMLDAGTISDQAFDAILSGSATDLYVPRAEAAKGKKLPVASPAPPKPPPGARSAHMPGVQPAASITQNDPVSQRALDRLSY